MDPNVEFCLDSAATLFFTYIIPIVPLILVLDGYVSAYRTRSLPHLMHLANLAAVKVSLERGKSAEGEEDVEWLWESGTKKHTWPGGVMTWVIGRRDRSVSSEDEINLRGSPN